MQYAIQVNSSYTRSSIPHIAHRFVSAAIKEGHGILRVFFYHDGVYNGFGLASGTGPAKRNPDGPDWSSLAERYGVDLVLCVTASEIRGLTEASLLPGFRLAGLGLWMEACLKADRFIVFEG